MDKNTLKTHFKGAKTKHLPACYTNRAQIPHEQSRLLIETEPPTHPVVMLLKSVWTTWHFQHRHAKTGQIGFFLSRWQMLTRARKIPSSFQHVPLVCPRNKQDTDNFLFWKWLISAFQHNLLTLAFSLRKSTRDIVEKYPSRGQCPSCRSLFFSCFLVHVFHAF